MTATTDRPAGERLPATNRAGTAGGAIRTWLLIVAGRACILIAAYMTARTR